MNDSKVKVLDEEPGAQETGVQESGAQESDTPASKEVEGRLDGAVAWKLCRDRLGKDLPADRSMIDWTVRLRAREKGVEFADPLRHFWSSLPEVELPLIGDASSTAVPVDPVTGCGGSPPVGIGEFGICSQRQVEIFKDAACLKTPAGKLHFGDLYQVTGALTKFGSLSITIGRGQLEGYLPLTSHLAISPGEYRVLRANPRDVRLTFLVKILSQQGED